MSGQITATLPFGVTFRLYLSPYIDNPNPPKSP